MDDSEEALAGVQGGLMKHKQLFYYIPGRPYVISCAFMMIFEELQKPLIIHIIIGQD